MKKKNYAFVQQVCIDDNLQVRCCFPHIMGKDVKKVQPPSIINVVMN